MSNNRIPKIIHYVWLGSSMPNNVKQNIAQWKEALPDYEFYCWGKKEYEKLETPLYVKQAYESGKYAFVADFIRLYALYNFGGIYLDTDVVIYRNFDNFLKYSFVISYEVYARLSTAVIVSCPYNEDLKNILNWYNTAKFKLTDGTLDMSVNTILFFEYFLKKYKISLLDKTQKIEDKLFLNSSYLSAINVFTHKVKIKKCTTSAHYMYGSWDDAGKKKLKSLKKLPLIWRIFYLMGLLKNFYLYRIKKVYKIN